MSSTNYRLYAKLNTSRINKCFKRWAWIIKICLDYARQSERRPFVRRPVSFVAKKSVSLSLSPLLSLFPFFCPFLVRWRSVFPKWRIIGEYELVGSFINLITRGLVEKEREETSRKCLHSCIIPFLRNRKIKFQPRRFCLINAREIVQRMSEMQW